MIDECTWTAIGRPWMRLIHAFICDWSPSLASIVALDQFTRLAMIELHRTERSTYAKISDAAKEIMTIAKWHRYETVAFQKFQGHDATKIVNFRNMTMSIPTTDSLIPAMMRPHAPGKSPEGEFPMIKSELQSLIAKAENKVRSDLKGKGSQKGWKDWYSQHQPSFHDDAQHWDGKGNGKDWKGKGKGKEKKGKKWGGGGGWTPPPVQQKDQKRGNPPGGDGAGAPKVSRRVPPGEFKRILDAAAKTPDQLFCYQYNATAGCTKPDCGGPDRLHRCAECGAEHGMIANH
jgi:hypothetical protein